jgi:streptogramin lyase
LRRAARHLLGHRLGRLLGIAALLAAAAPPAAAREGRILDGRVLDAESGAPVAGATVTASRTQAEGPDGPQRHEVTVFSRDDGAFSVPAPDGVGPVALRVRRIGWREAQLADAPGPDPVAIRLAREPDRAALAAQLPANRWWALVLARVDDEAQREELVRQCGYCHQQGSPPTRRSRTPAEWEALLERMGRMGGIVSPALRARIPEWFEAAYAPEHAVAALTAGADEPDFAPPPDADARRARIEEWTLGGRASLQHDLVVHPDGRVYSVDMTQDRVYRLDPAAPDGDRRAWAIPRGDLPRGGVLAAAGDVLPDGYDAHVGPHSLQVAPDGALWITLALGNRLARFDPASETFAVHEVPAGAYPHTLRFDARGRIWYTLAASNHVGMLDPATGAARAIRLPARDWDGAVTMRLLPAFLWLGRRVDLRGAAARSGTSAAPIPYGIDVAPDGGVWFSQLDDRRIGRIDPESFAVETIDTPFPGPRRLRFDAQGGLWIPSFSSARLARFDPATRRFQEWALPIEPAGSEMPYALHVERRTGFVWICGANSDSLLRFQPRSERFTVYPLPTRGTYTREIDFDSHGRVWTSSSSSPPWHMEGGLPKLVRLDPGPANRHAIDVLRLRQGR